MTYTSSMGFCILNDYFYVTILRFGLDISILYPSVFPFFNEIWGDIFIYISFSTKNPHLIKNGAFW